MGLMAVAAPPATKWLIIAAAVLQLLVSEKPCLALAPGEAVNALLQRTSHRLSLNQITVTRYWDRLVQRFTPEFSDSSSIYEMTLAQQRWRRAGPDTSQVSEQQ